MERKTQSMYVEGLDKTDGKIVNELLKDARQSYSDIAEKVGLSRVAVKTRMDNLEKKGIIKGYKAMIDPEGLPEGRRFFMDVVTEPDQFDAVVERIAKYSIIRKVHAVTGDCRIRVEGYATSNMKYEMYMKNLKRNMEGIRSIVVQDVMYTIKDVDAGVDYEGIRDYLGKEDSATT